MPRVNKYCFDCGTRLKYVPALSTPKLPNEFRHMAYTCEKCNDKNDVNTYEHNPQEEPLIKIILVNKQASEIPVETVNIKITEYRKACERIQKGEQKRAKYYQDLKDKKDMINGTGKYATPEIVDTGLNY